jgi:hypothetical protein
MTNIYSLENQVVSSTDTYIPPNNLSVYSIIQSIYFKCVMIILILSYLGYNIFKSLAVVTDHTTTLITDPLNYILNKFGYVLTSTKNIVSLGADGVKLGIDVSAGAAKDAVNIGEEVIGIPTSLLDTAISKSTVRNTKKPIPDEPNHNPTLMPGFCYIGEDRGVRSCIKVNESQLCMSGDIYPTQDICVNPTLRT